MVNSKGEVIGVNTAIIAMVQGLCFAVSSNLTHYVVGKLILEGKVKRTFIGIAGQTISLSERIISYKKAVFMLLKRIVTKGFIALICLLAI